MTDNVIQFIPRANPKADRAFWKGGDKTTRDRNPDGGSAEPDTTSSEYVAPESDPA